VFPFAFKRLIHRLSREPTLLLKHAGIGRFVIALVAVLVIDSLIGAIGYHIALWGLPPPPSDMSCGCFLTRFSIP